MAKKRARKRRFPRVDLDTVRRFNRLIRDRVSETVSARSDQLAIAVLRKFLGQDWIEKHVGSKTPGFLNLSGKTPLEIESRRMRRVALAEMLFNLQKISGFDSCVENLADGQIESTYASLDVARMLLTMAVDKTLTIRFVARSGIKRRDYDLSIKFGDGVHVRAETKCKLEETAITLRTLDESFSQAKTQLPKRAPSVIFMKIPRSWINDAKFSEGMKRLAQNVLRRTSTLVSIKYYISNIVIDPINHMVGEIVAFDEQANLNHCFRKWKKRSFQMFPNKPGATPPTRMNYNGMPATWQRLIVQNSGSLG
jgi:hypothetical protein